jgi:hypothetical protein
MYPTGRERIRRIRGRGPHFEASADIILGGARSGPFRTCRPAALRFLRENKENIGRHPGTKSVENVLSDAANYGILQHPEPTGL